ncbi:MAG: hypothetical protein JSU73_02540 [candidate division WOR-3 bacterium]|nr:MAG: hypothetical protein JSU73_02540 [candidate division WOR-3 bacterium]
MRILVLTATLLALAGPLALAQSNVPEIGIRSYWREDIALESILSPPDTVYVGDTIHPAVMGRNYGRGARSAYMWCNIDNGMVGVYASIQGVTPPTRDSFTVTFAVPWIAELPGKDYYVRFTFPTGPPRDPWPENDTIGKHFIVLPREGGLDGSRPRNRVRGEWCDDLEVVGFFGIPDTIRAGDTIHPSVLLKNHGFGARHAYLRFALDDGSYRVIYSTIQGVIIPSRDTTRVGFAIPFTFGPGTYTFMAWISHQDSWPENDSAWKTLLVLPRNTDDVGFDSILSPPDTMRCGRSYGQDVRARNSGDDPVVLYVYACLGDTLGSLLYSERVIVELPPRSTSVLELPVLALGDPGVWCVAYKHRRPDANPNNDSIGKRVVVLPWKGVADVDGAEPAPDFGQLAVGPSIVRVGGRISVSGLGPGARAELIDAAGRVVGLLAPGSTAIAAPCLPGVYFIRREEDDRTTRVLVQP